MDDGQLPASNPKRAMHILVNGKPHELVQPMPLRQVLEGLALPTLERGVAVAVNGEIVRHAEWEQRVVRPKDELEIVQAAQGG